jgi:hypothetical protein
MFAYAESTGHSERSATFATVPTTFRVLARGIGGDQPSSLIRWTRQLFSVFSADAFWGAYRNVKSDNTGCVVSPKSDGHQSVMSNLDQNRFSAIRTVLDPARC